MTVPCHTLSQFNAGDNMYPAEGNPFVNGQYPPGLLLQAAGLEGFRNAPFACLPTGEGDFYLM